MRALVLTGHGPPEVLQVKERADPGPPGPGMVLVDVRAAGLNFADVMARIGFYPDAPKPPCVLGYEVAGTVADVGAGVEGVSPGARVVAGVRFGGQAERVLVRAGDVFPLPDRLSFEQGAAIPVNYCTAWYALMRAANLQPDERVLIHAAAGGVGIAATQIAKRHGAEVYGTASASKHEAIRGFGVDHPIDYRTDGWERGVPKLDVVLDALGGRSFRTSYELLRAGGRLVAYGASSVVSGERRNLVTAARAAIQMPRFNLIKQMSESKSVLGLNLLSLWDELESMETFTQPIADLLEDRTIQPVVADAVPFNRAPDAHRILAERRNVGKVVLVP